MKYNELELLRVENENLREALGNKGIQNGWAFNILERLVITIENNTGNEPSISCYYRALEEAKSLVDRINNSASVRTFNGGVK